MFGPTIKDILSAPTIGKTITVNGWVRTFRSNRFISLQDGSTDKRLQAVVEFERFPVDILKRIDTGAALSVKGKLVASQGSGQEVELLVDTFEYIGDVAPGFPLQPKEHSLEFLREKAHLRFRTTTFGSVFRIRHAVSFAIHEYFDNHGFFWIHTPIITASDAEGAGELFRVTTFDPENIPRDENGRIDENEDFFGKRTFLTVSGQLEAELAAMGLSRVYTFGPTFRAENSNTSRHLAEFWMIEPEMAFTGIEENMDVAEDLLKYIIRFALLKPESRMKKMGEIGDSDLNEDILQLNTVRKSQEEKLKKELRSELTLIEQLKFVLENPFERITYTEAIEILMNSQPNRKKKFQYVIDGWGADLQSEHERYLVEKHFKKPVIIRDYPKEIKAFYMRQNDDGKTVRAMDILFPGIGEVVGGSQREERLDKLESRMKEMEIDARELWWYLETRRFGTVPHSGFGLGLERLMLFITGMTNVRDVIAFPRSPKNAEF